jgi:phospholipid/cholesterol/gamma-HCH transport system permease protein
MHERGAEPVAAFVRRFRRFVSRRLQGLGAATFEALREYYDGGRAVLAALGASIVEAARPLPFSRRRIGAELYDAAWRPLGVVLLVALGMGFITATLASRWLHDFSVDAIVLEAVRPLVVRELSPLLVAMLLAGRSGVALATRLRAMLDDGQADSLVLLGVDPLRYALTPALVAWIPANAALCVITSFTALLYIDVARSATVMGGSARVLPAVASSDLGWALLKGAAFTLAIAAAAAGAASSTSRRGQAAGRAPTRAFAAGFVAVILLATAFLAVQP